MATIKGLHANLIVGVAFFQRAEMFKHVQCDRKGFGRNLDMRRPATELLVSRYAIGKNTFIDVRKIRFFRLGYHGRWRLVHIDARLSVSPHESFRHIRL